MPQNLSRDQQCPQRQAKPKACNFILAKCPRNFFSRKLASQIPLGFFFADQLVRKSINQQNQDQRTGYSAC